MVEPRSTQPPPGAGEAAAAPERGPAPHPDYESTPLPRSEYIAAMVHLYRGELYRANSWRIRLDNTTNWAVLTTAGLLSFSFGPGVHSHWILLIGLPLVSIFWAFEARRFRFADVWRSRVRKIEENFYGPILRRDPVSPDRGWGELVAADLFHPRFKIGRFTALRVRLLRNYWAIYIVLVFAWCLKVWVTPTPAESWGSLKQHLAMGSLAWWVPLAFVGTFVLLLLGLALFGPREHRRDEDVWHDRAEGAEGHAVLDL